MIRRMSGGGRLKSRKRGAYCAVDMFSHVKVTGFENGKSPARPAVSARPGEYTLGVDNVDHNEDVGSLECAATCLHGLPLQGPQEYGGQRLWDGDLPCLRW